MRHRSIEDFFERPFTLDRIGRIVFMLLLLVALLWGFGKIGTLLMPFGLAWLCAYILQPVIHFIEQKLKIKQRWLSVLIIVLLLAGVVTLVLTFLIPSIANEVRKGWELMMYYDFGSFIMGLFPEELNSRLKITKSIEEAISSINIQEFLNSAQSVLNRGWNIVQSTFSYLSSFAVVFLFFLYFVFILIDYERLSSGFYSLLPRSTRPFFKEFFVVVRYYIDSYFKGQALIATISGVLMAIGFWIMGLPMGITLGLFIGLLNMVPYLQNLGIIPLILLVALQSVANGQSFWILLLIGLGVILLTDVLQDTFLTPYIHGQMTGLRPSIILLSLTIWGSIFGLLGMLFALPLTMIIYTYYMKYIVGEPLPPPEPVAKKEPFWKKNKQKNDEE